MCVGDTFLKLSSLSSHSEAQNPCCCSLMRDQATLDENGETIDEEAKAQALGE